MWPPQELLWILGTYVVVYEMKHKYIAYDFRGILIMTLYEFTFRQSVGAKTFSNCSLSDFRSFISKVGAKCLQNKPQMQKSPRPVCGNGKVEENETCDCGTEQVSLITRKTD